MLPLCPLASAYLSSHPHMSPVPAFFPAFCTCYLRRSTRLHRWVPKERSLGRIRSAFWGWARSGPLGRVPGFWIWYLSGEGGGRTRALQPMTFCLLQSSQSVYGTPARICAPEPRQTTYVSLISRRNPEIGCRAGSKQKTPFPRLLARFSIVGFTVMEVSHIFAVIQWSWLIDSML